MKFWLGLKYTRNQRSMTLVYSFHVGVKHSNTQFQQVLKVDGSELERAVSSMITRKRGGGGEGALQVLFVTLTDTWKGPQEFFVLSGCPFLVGVTSDAVYAC